MKLLISILLSCFCFCVNAQVKPDYIGYVHPKITAAMVKNPHYIDNTSQFPRFYKGNDTFIVRISVITGGVDFGQDSGLDWNHPLVIINGVDQVVINGGVRCVNSQYVSLLGWGSDSTYGFKMVNGGTGGNFDGMQKCNRYYSCDYVGGSQGGVWIKQDPNNACQFPNEYNQYAPDPNNPSKDTSKYKYANVYQYLYAGNKPYDSVLFLHNRVRSCGGEGIYFGSTDYIMSNGQWERQVPCLGNAALAPTQLQNCRADSNDVDTTGRTGIQMSQATAGTNSISYNHIRNTGYEYLVTHDQGALSQGAAVRVGWAWNQQPNRLMNVIGNFGDTSLIYFLDIAEASNVQSNYFGTHFGQVYYNGTSVINPQQNPSGRFFAQNKAVGIQHICSNNLLSTTGGGNVTFAVYWSTNYLTSGNHANANNAPVVFFGGGSSAFDTDCGAIIDTGCVNKDTTFFRDSYVTGHFDSTFTDSIGKVWVPEKWQTKVQKNGKYRQIIIGDSVITHFTVLVRAAYDSVYICSLCQKVDTTICVPIIRTVGYGAFILDGYNSLTTTAQKLHYAKATLQVPNLRENWSFGNVWQNQQYLDSGINPIATMSSSQINGTPHSFPTNATAVQDTVTSKFANSKPPIAGWENEPGTILYWDSTGGGIFQANQYKIGYYAFIAACNAAGVKSVDGAITYPVIYSLADYYQRNGKSDSLTYLSTATGIMNFTNMPLKIYWRDFFNTLLPIIRNGNADYVQFHMYGDTLSVPNKLLTVLLNYIVQQTGKQIVTFETGTDLTGHADFNSFMTEWTKQNPAYMLYYLSASSPPVTNESYFIQFKTNNP